MAIPEQFFGVRWPIILAPMGGGSGTPELAAAVANAGGLGSLSGGYLTPQQIKETTAKVRQLTTQPININLFVLDFPPPPTDIAAAVKMLEPFHQELGIDPPALPPRPPSYDEQVRAVLELEPAIFSFTFGVPSREIIDAFHARGAKVIGTATTVTEGKILQEAGVDAIVAQGSEAGAHRGTFNHPFEEAMVSIMSLVPQLVATVSIPVIASGGIMNGAGIRAAFELGARGVQLGTAFLVCPEAGTPECYKKAIQTAGDHTTSITRAFSGRPARGIRNRFLIAGEQHPEALLQYPWQNGLTQKMRRAASQANNPEMLSLWAGQSARMARPMPAGELVKLLVKEAGETKTL